MLLARFTTPKATFCTNTHIGFPGGRKILKKNRPRNFFLRERRRFRLPDGRASQQQRSDRGRITLCEGEDILRFLLRALASLAFTTRGGGFVRLDTGVVFRSAIFCWLLRPLLIWIRFFGCQRIQIKIPFSRLWLQVKCYSNPRRPQPFGSYTKKEHKKNSTAEFCEATRGCKNSKKAKHGFFFAPLSTE